MTRLYLYQKLLDWRPAEYTHEDLVRLGYFGVDASGARFEAPTSEQDA